MSQHSLLFELVPSLVLKKKGTAYRNTGIHRYTATLMPAITIILIDYDRV